MGLRMMITLQSLDPFFEALLLYHLEFINNFHSSEPFK